MKLHTHTHTCTHSLPAPPASPFPQGVRSGAALLALGCFLLPRAGREAVGPGEARRGLNPPAFSSRFLSPQPQPGGGTFPAQSSSGSQRPQPNAGERRNKVGGQARERGWEGSAHTKHHSGLPASCAVTSWARCHTLWDGGGHPPALPPYAHFPDGKTEARGRNGGRGGRAAHLGLKPSLSCLPSFISWWQRGLFWARRRP